MAEIPAGQVVATKCDAPSHLLHELRTPLNHITGYAQLLLEQAEDAGNAVLVRDLKKIVTASYRMTEIISANFNSVKSPGGVAVVTAAAPHQEPPTSPRLDSGDAISQSMKPVPVTQQKSADSCADGEAHAGRVLIVDDLESNISLVAAGLAGQGYAMQTARNGVEAMQLLGASEFDLVILDVLMPEMDGQEVLRKMKSDETLKHIPVIMVSAFGDAESIAQCLEVGAEDYLQKPFNAALLRARITGCLEKKRARDREVALYQKCQTAYARLSELEESRDDLTNMMVHDLRTPLTAVILGMNVLETLGDLSEEQREMINITTTGGNTLLGLITELLDVDRLRSGHMQLERTTFPAATLVKSAFEQVATSARQGKLEFTHRIAPNVRDVYGDEATLRRALVNLLGNAIKFTPAGGAVSLEVSRPADGSAVEFAVSDTGEGIPEAEFARIFEKYGQLDSLEGKRKAGSGLGLTFCKLVAEAHGGSISVESSAARGSTFRLTIPNRALTSADRANNFSAASSG